MRKRELVARHLVTEGFGMKEYRGYVSEPVAPGHDDQYRMRLTLSPAPPAGDSDTGAQLGYPVRLADD